MQSIFVYRAVSSSGSTERGTVDAESAVEARVTLLRRGLFVVGLEEKGLLRERREPLSASDLALGLRILASLLESGLPAFVRARACAFAHLRKRRCADCGGPSTGHLQRSAAGMIKRRGRRGVTLIELLVTLAIMGVILGVTALAVRRIDPPPPDDPYYIVGDSLRRAVAEGRSAVIRLLVNGVAVAATVHADGSVVADSLLSFDRFSGRPLHAR